jgi:hypothetical protein
MPSLFLMYIAHTTPKVLYADVMSAKNVNALIKRLFYVGSG